MPRDPLPDVLDRMQPVCSTAGIRAVEAAVLSVEPPPPLMERAGLAAARIARQMLGAGNRILVVAGPGNNGGDAFVAARHLRQWWHEVTVIFAGTAERLSAEARAALDEWRAAGGAMSLEWPGDGRFDLVLDGLFGIGLERPLEGRSAELVARINAAGAPVLALDVPSGLHADSGRVLGTAVRATRTATFITLKPGLLTLDGPDHAGVIDVCPLDLDPAALPGSPGRVIDGRLVPAVLPRRPRNSHKGTFGDVGIIGGAQGMTGAALLAGRAALKLGAGRVVVGFLGPDAPSVDPAQPELMLRKAQDIASMPDLSVAVLGPGLGQSSPAVELAAHCLQRDLPVVVDADALNLAAAHTALAELLRKRPAESILTPHPAEAGRLLGRTTADVQADRVAAAVALAQRYRAAVVLKGAGSICAAPDGRWFVNTSGNPGMASAGMGDVLAGIVGALVAQGVAALPALLSGVHLHGLAADHLAQAAGGLVGITAGEVADRARAVVNALVYGNG